VKLGAVRLRVGQKECHGTTCTEDISFAYGCGLTFFLRKGLNLLLYLAYIIGYRVR